MTSLCMYHALCFVHVEYSVCHEPISVSMPLNFLDINVRLVEGKLMTDLFVKPTDTHQFLDPSSSHPYHCKKGIPYSQALRLNRICSDNESFDKRCNHLEGWFMKRGYNGKMIRK